MGKSFSEMHPELASEFSERDLPLMASDITYGSNKKYWWSGRCGHEWTAEICARVKGTGCPYCSNSRVKRNYRDDNSALVLVPPYLSAEYEKNEEAFQEYYDEVEICQSSSAAHFKAAMQLHNREMVDRADLVLCCIERKSGGAYQTVLYAKKQNKQIINLAGGMTALCE